MIDEDDKRPLTKNDFDKVLTTILSCKVKNPDAVALGKLGGLKGGKARAEKLTAEQRSDIAKKGAEKRWGKKDEVEVLKDKDKQVHNGQEENKINYDDMA